MSVANRLFFIRKDWQQIGHRCLWLTNYLQAKPTSYPTMEWTSRSKSVSDSQDKSKVKKSKIQDGGSGHDNSGNSGKQSPMPGAISPISSSTTRKARGMHTSPLNLSGPRKLPPLPTGNNSPTIKEKEVIICALLTCRKEVKESDNAVSCNKCNRWLHQSTKQSTCTKHSTESTKREKI